MVPTRVRGQIPRRFVEGLARDKRKQREHNECLVGACVLCAKSSLRCLGRYVVVHINLSNTEVLVWCVDEVFNRGDFMAIVS